MCGRFGVTAAAEDFVDLFPEFSEKEIKLEPRYNIKPTELVPVVYSDTAGKRQFDFFKWGFHPPWAKSLLINTRMETAFTSRYWKTPMLHRRCLIPVSFFYEWQDTGEAHTQPWLIGIRGKPLFCLAGIWGNDKDKTGAPVHACSIITTEGNDVMRTIHNHGEHKFRQPVIIEPSQFALWMSENTPENVIHDMMLPIESKLMDTRKLVKIGDDRIHAAPVFT